MAIYHLTVNVISRARGQSVVAAAAYRSGARLRDERYGVSHNYLGKGGVVFAEILAPAWAPPWVYDREALWNRVEAGEARKDSQLARVIEIGLPIELDVDECVSLMRDYTAGEFVAKGMIADFCIRRENPGNPHAHVLLTLRTVMPTGFGSKERRWNRKASLIEWRAGWADRANAHLARAGHPVRIDHRTLEAQQIELTPGRNLGAGRAPRARSKLPDHLLDRLDDQRRIANHNGQAILEDPTVAIRALSYQRPIFTTEDLARYLQPRTTAAQFDAAYLAVIQSAELVALQPQDGQDRFTSRDMIEAARSLRHRAVSMAARRGHGVAPERWSAVLSQRPLSDAQRRSFDYLVGDGDAKAVAVAEADKVSLLAASRLAWERCALRVCAVARSIAAAERLAAASGIESRTLASLEGERQEGRVSLDGHDVLVVDGAEMLGLKSLERILGMADKARAKIVLIGDAAELRAMKVESPFHGVLREIGLPEPAGGS